eukprot:SAG22_NODE_3886_length_1482_cov_2.809834_2_plen_37_part_01
MPASEFHFGQDQALDDPVTPPPFPAELEGIACAGGGG